MTSEVRAEAQALMREIGEAEYGYFAGLEPNLDRRSIYERHPLLTNPATARYLRSVGDESAGVGELWKLCCRMSVSGACQDAREELAREERRPRVMLDGESRSFSALRHQATVAPNADARADADDALAEAAALVAPAYAEEWGATRAAVAAVGFEDERDFAEALFGIDLDELGREARLHLDRTRAVYTDVVGGALTRRTGVPLADARVVDLLRLITAPPGPDVREATELADSTLRGLGVRLRRQRNVTLDVDERPGKVGGAFCAAIDIPRRIVVTVSPSDTADGVRALFHELGHAEHFAHIDPDLPFETRSLGDQVATEGWAFLFERLLDDEAWLRTHGTSELYAAADDATVRLLIVSRLQCVRLLYELERVRGRIETAPALAELYDNLVREAVGARPGRGEYLRDANAGFSSAIRLRSWAFESQVRGMLQTEFGETWHASSAAGELLRAEWAKGQPARVDDALEALTGMRIEIGAIADRIEQAPRRGVAA